MNNKEIYRLDHIIKNISYSINDSISEISEMIESSKNDYKNLEIEFRKLKYEATKSINKVNRIEERLNHNLYRIKEEEYIYDKEIDDLRIDLAIEKEKEQNLIQRRNEIENHLKIIRQISSKSEQLKKSIELANQLLSGNIKDLSDTIDNIQANELMGIKILEAQENERQRIAREMHDGPAQSLTNLIHKTELCIKLIDKDTVRTRLELQSVKNVIRNTIDDTRRIIYNLRPMSIDDLGLIPTLERYIEKISEEVIFKTELKVFNDEYNVQPIINLTLFRIVQEALNNIDKYAKAKKVIIKVVYTDKYIELYIIDNGVGFDVKDVKFNISKGQGFGLSMMKERVYLLSGQLKINSVIDEGTTYYVKVPVNFSKEECN